MGRQAMIGVWCYAVCVLLSLAPAGVFGDCGTPGAGLCNANNSQYINDRKVWGSAAGHCDFQGSLCDYRQGCRDQHMTPWTATNGYAQARQEETGCGGASYTVLESPWINLTTPACLTFTFARFTPQALEVFLVSWDSNNVRILLGEEQNSFNNGEAQTERHTVQSAVGKIVFRLYGGAPGENEPYLKLFPVSFLVGMCKTPGCNFDDKDDPFCGWTSVNWAREDSDKVNVKTTGVATLTSPLTRATGENQRVCLSFEFKFRNPRSTLNVTVEVSAMSVTVWSVTSDVGTKWTNAKVPIATRDAYQIVFRGLKADASHKLLLRQVSVEAETGRSCQTEPGEAAVNVTLPLGPAPTNDNDNSQTSSASDGGVIGGVIAAVLIIIIIGVIVGIFFYRRRLKRQPGKKSSSKDRQHVPAFKTDASEWTNEQSNDNYMEIEDPPLPRPRSENDYTEIADVPTYTEIMAPSDDVSPYEMADDGSLMPQNTSSGSRFNNTSIHQYNNPAFQAGSSKSGDYNHISSSQAPKPNPPSNAVTDDYSHIRSPQNAFPAGNRSPNTGQDTRNGAAVGPHPDYELARVHASKDTEPQAKTSAGYSLAQLKDHSMAAASHSVLEGGDYSLAALEEIGPNPSRFASDNVHTDGSSSDYSLQKPVQKIPGDYNTLQFDETRQENRNGAARDPYDHVQRDPDDGYSKTQIGQRNVVIDFDYDHVKH